MAAPALLPAEPARVWPILLHYRPGLDLSDPKQFFAFCQDNAPWQIERTPEGGIVVKMPTGGESSHRCLELSVQVALWSRQDGTGKAFDSSGGFDLPNGAMRSPDAAWVRGERLQALTAEQKRGFLPLAPDFAAELRSETDRLKDLQEKMEEYIGCGVRVALLLDPFERRVWVYRPGVAPLVLENPARWDGAPELPGLLLDLAAVFDATL